MRTMTASVLPAIRRCAPQPLISIVTSLGALLAFGASSRVPFGGAIGGEVSLACVLILGFLLSRQIRLHIRSGVKLFFGSVPLYLMVALLAPPIAVASVVLAKVGGDCSTRKERGLLPSDIVTEAGRSAVVASIAAAIAHAGLRGDVLPLLAAAIVMLAGDILTSPLVLAPVLHERPARIIALVARDAGLKETAQYLVGVAAAFIAGTSIWALGAIALAIAVTYGAIRLAAAARSLRLAFSPRLLIAGAALLLNAVGAPLLSSSASADIGACRTDPIVVLSNGITVHLSASIATNKTNVQNVTYVLHAPAGTTVRSVTYTAGASAIEHLQFYADDTAGAYDSATTVSLVGGSATVTARTLVSGVGSGSVSGSSGDTLSLHLGN